MLPFGIPDTRLFWSLDQRFLEQLKEGEISGFVLFSKFPLLQRRCLLATKLEQ
ncbi:hypothetical protein B9Z19DRAFT_1163003 [Tuber borchii]|uniref:Uncharacterized protein n=1 Tax=Tuber borchii TaxID=42251 RepID=A0A2T6ZDF1_TUBBO|nr:hypothetical protein B9Z19DRAFT_1163003 [Tuber borchii]